VLNGLFGVTLWCKKTLVLRKDKVAQCNTLQFVNMITDMTELALSAAVVAECRRNDETADVQSCDDDANHSLLHTTNNLWRFYSVV